MAQPSEISVTVPTGSVDDSVTSAPAFYVSASDGSTFAVDDALWRAPDGSHLNLTPGQGLRENQIDRGERSLWRYAQAIRVDGDKRISLGEGWTPLIASSWAGTETHFKLEFLAPTGSFKDRGMSVLLTYLKGVGITSVLEDSSGNAGASMAAYAAAGGLKCRILAPAAAPKGKVVQIAAMGADVALVPGSRQDVADAALQEAEHLFYASHNWQPYFLEGTKTLAFELWEQFDFKPPEVIVVPLGYGSNVLGLWLGFNELLACGAIAKLPRIYAAQAANCAAFVPPWKAGMDEWMPFEPRPTMADGIASIRPVRLKEVLAAIRGSGGALVAVIEDEIAAALRGFLTRGLFVEPTSATAGAAFQRLCETNEIGPGESSLVVLTGSGLKATQQIAEVLAASGSLLPKTEEELRR